MKKNKGFTLIELLAVIVILAIIALIATPLILNIINRARKQAFQRSAEGVLKAGKNYYLLEQLEPEEFNKVTFHCENDKCLSEDNKELEVEGNVGTGEVTIDKQGNIALKLSNGSYCVYKSSMQKATSIVDGECYENLWFTNKQYPFTKNGLTIDYDYETQIYTLNGTSTEAVNFMYLWDCDDDSIKCNKNENWKTYRKYNWNLNDEYIVNTYYISGNINYTSNNNVVAIKMDFKLEDGSVTKNPQQQIVAYQSKNAKNISSPIYKINSISKDTFGYNVYVGNWQEIVTYNNYRFKVYFGKNGPKEYIPNVLDR